MMSGFWSRFSSSPLSPLPPARRGPGQDSADPRAPSSRGTAAPRLDGGGRRRRRHRLRHPPRGPCRRHLLLLLLPRAPEPGSGRPPRARRWVTRRSPWSGAALALGPGVWARLGGAAGRACPELRGEPVWAEAVSLTLACRPLAGPVCSLRTAGSEIPRTAAFGLLHLAHPFALRPLPSLRSPCSSPELGTGC